MDRATPFSTGHGSHFGPEATQSVAAAAKSHTSSVAAASGVPEGWPHKLVTASLDTSPVTRLGVCVGSEGKKSSHLFARSQSTLPCVGRASARHVKRVKHTGDQHALASRTTHCVVSHSLTTHSLTFVHLCRTAQHGDAPVHADTALCVYAAVVWFVRASTSPTIQPEVSNCASRRVARAENRPLSVSETTRCARPQKQ